jgi:hypothetical protein
MKVVSEIGTSRLLKHFTDDKTMAVISTYRTERTEAENRSLLKRFKAEVRDMKLGFSEFVSKWVEEDGDGNMVSSDERSLAVYDISREDAMEFGRQYQQSSILFKDSTGCYEICTCAFIDYDGNKFSPGDVVRQFNFGTTPLNLKDAEDIFSKRKGGPASMPVKSNRAFRLNEMYEVESEKATTFSSRERWIPLFGK